MSHENDLVGGERLTQVLDHGVEVCHVLCHGQPVRIRLGIKRSTRPSLVPVRHHEPLLELTVEVAKQRPLRTARPAMKPEQHWCAGVRSADEQVELRAVGDDIVRSIDGCRLRGGTG
jgi:hypothetical protein